MSGGISSRSDWSTALWTHGLVAAAVASVRAVADRALKGLERGAMAEGREGRNGGK